MMHTTTTNEPSNIKVFVLEDEQPTALVIEKSLQNLGYHVCGIADSYDSALQAIQQAAPDIAICDINLKGHKDGIDVAEAINQILPQPIPIIFLTGYHEQYKERAYAFKPANYLIKIPFTDQQSFQLDAAIQVALLNIQQITQSEETTSRVVGGEFYDVWMGGIFERIKIQDIYYLKADNMKTLIVTAEKTWDVKSKSLGKVMSELIHPDVVRCNRSEAINVKKIKYYNQGPSRISLDVETLKNHIKEKISTFITVSENHRADVRKALGLE